MTEIRKIKRLTGGVVEVPTHKIDLGEAIKLQKIHRENGNAVVETARSYESTIAGELTTYFTFGGESGLNEMLRSLIIDTSHFGFMGKIKAYAGITRAVPEIDKTLRKEVVKGLHEIMNLRNAHTHGTLITRGTEVYLRYFEGEIKEKLLDQEYWDRAESLILGLAPQMAKLNGLLYTHVQKRISEISPSAEINEADISEDPD